ncbi:MAG: hypothetical protein HYU41_25760 [Candidatus Rokubacteria bacterium]|nr:hypothetical protein [Candidatus Rokubacteria bacterium]
MILHVNTVQKGSAARARDFVEALMELVEGGQVDAALLPSLRVQLDWIQYRTNFREPIVLRRAIDMDGSPLGLAEIAVDLRQSDRGWRALLPASLGTLGIAGDDPERRYLEGFTPLRAGLLWSFNRLFWQRLDDWEAATGRHFEQALPAGQSDANHAEAIADSVAEFWTMLADMDKRGHLPAEIFALEIGVGSGVRAARWLDRFRALDDERSTRFYPRLRFLLGDYSIPTLDRAMAAVAGHRDIVSVMAMDALNPFKTLSFLRYKLLYVHLTNVYDNLPADELVRRDGRLWLVEARAYLPRAETARIAAAHDVPADDVVRTVEKLVEIGPDVLRDRARGIALWRDVWAALRLEERLVRLDDVAQAPLPPGLDRHHLDDLLETAPQDVRFHLSRGAAESFGNTLPLLHPRGYLQVQDIFVTSMDEYRQGFRGPGKLDGSVVNWVNGALLRAVAARAGYDVHFTPFRYRTGSRTSILYTTQRD